MYFRLMSVYNTLVVRDYVVPSQPLEHAGVVQVGEGVDVALPRAPQHPAEKPKAVSTDGERAS